MMPASRDHFFCRTPGKLRISTNTVFKEVQDSVFGVNDNLEELVDKDWVFFYVFYHRFQHFLVDPALLMPT